MTTRDALEARYDYGMMGGMEMICDMLSARRAFEKADEIDAYRELNKAALIAMGKDWRPADQRLAAKAEMWREEGRYRQQAERRER